MKEECKKKRTFDKVLIFGLIFMILLLISYNIYMYKMTMATIDYIESVDILNQALLNKTFLC